MGFSFFIPTFVIALPLIQQYNVPEDSSSLTAVVMRLLLDGATLL